MSDHQHTHPRLDLDVKVSLLLILIPITFILLAWGFFDLGERDPDDFAAITFGGTGLLSLGAMYVLSLGSIKLVQCSAARGLEDCEQEWRRIIRQWLLAHYKGPPQDGIQAHIYFKGFFCLKDVEIYAAGLDKHRFPIVRGDTRALLSKLRGAMRKEIGPIRSFLLMSLVSISFYPFEIRSPSKHEIMGALLKQRQRDQTA